MSSLYEELAQKLAKDPGLTKRGGARYDLGILLFDFRDALHDLYLAAERYAAARDDGTLADLRGAVEGLRPLFGERSAS